MSAAHILLEIKNISKKNKLTAEWEREYSLFLERNKRKSLLMGYIRQMIDE